jgi:dTDP-4-dehydrorhamnose reductase
LSLVRSSNSPVILLLGKNGQVGWELQRTLAPLGVVVALDYPEIDFKDSAALRKLVLDLKPSLVINAAAHTAVDRAESEPDLAHQINAVAPGVLAEAARFVDAWMVHFSTDYIFDGTKRVPYAETDEPNPLGVYGRSKLAGELAVKAAGGRHLVFRLCWVYGNRGQNFMLTMQRLAREREVIKVVNDQFGAPSWSRLIAEAVALASLRVLFDPAFAGASGLYHLCNSGLTSWHGFASRIIESMPVTERKVREVMAIPTQDYPTPAKRPAYSVLDCQKIAATFGVGLPEWDQALGLVLERK